MNAKTLVTYYKNFLGKHKATLIVALVLLMTQAVAFAQTPEPPELSIPVDSMIGYINTWTGTFAPIILFIGMIPVAIGLLRYVTNLFKSAFGG